MTRTPTKSKPKAAGSPDGNKDTVAAIMGKLNEARTTLDDLEQSVSKEIAALNQRIQLGPPLSAAQLKRWEFLYDKHKAIIRAQGDAAWQALMALEDSPAIAELKTELDGLRDGLDETLQGLNSIAKFADSVQAIIGAVVAAIGAAAGLKLPP